MTTLEQGIHRGVEYETYASWDALRSSYLSKFRRSPRHAYASLLEAEEPTAAMQLGTAIHAAILEPEAFEKEYVAAPKTDRRTTASKEAWAIFQARNAGKSILRAEDMETCLRIRESVWQEPWAEGLLGGSGENELSAVWSDAEFKVPCKLRIDRFSTATSSVIDVKSATDASRDAFSRAIENYSYHVQAAMYLDGLDTLSPHERRFLWIAVEKTPPYAAAVYEADEYDLMDGRKRYRGAIAMHLECQRTGFWPGYDPHIRIIHRPPWARKETEGDEF